MSNPFDSQEAGDEKAGSLKRLLKMRKWIALVAVPLILFHLGWLDVDSLTKVIPAVDIPEPVVIDFLFGSALFQGVVFGMALYQFWLAYERSMSFRLTLDEQTDMSVFDVLEGSARDKLKDAVSLVAQKKQPPQYAANLEAKLNDVLAARSKAQTLQGRMQPIEVALDATKLIPTVLIWAFAVGWHVVSIASRWFPAAA